MWIDESAQVGQERISFSCKLAVGDAQFRKENGEKCKMEDEQMRYAMRNMCISNWSQSAKNVNTEVIVIVIGAKWQAGKCVAVIRYVMCA